jgi:DNA-directed RNA polymerase specialized sigma24 family protein
MGRPIKVLCASEDVKTELRRRANGRSSEHRKRFRAEIILLRLQGVKIEDVATRLNTSLRTVSIWSAVLKRVHLSFHAFLLFSFQ